MSIGYSGTPLVKKLGLKNDTRLVVIQEPGDYAALLGTLPPGLEKQPALVTSTNVVHVFVTRRQDLASHLATLRNTLRAEAAIWVSWPKKSSKVPSEVTEDTVRDIAIPLGFVDVKVCAVSEVWSGLKLVVRQERREKRTATNAFASLQLPAERTVVAPDGSDVRVLLGLAGGTMAHFELARGRVAQAVKHRTVDEIWYVLSGAGEMWRKQGAQEERIALVPGLSLTIPQGTHFQFRASASQSVAAVAITMPPWPGEGEAIAVAGPWEPSPT